MAGLRPTKEEIMKQALAVAFAVVLVVTARAAAAQQAGTATGLVNSWTLSAVEKDVSSGEPRRVRGARGLLVFDRAGHVFEFFSTASRDEPESPMIDPLRTLASFGGFWGRYEVDTEAGRIVFEAADGVSPSVAGSTFARRFELDGDRLVVTSADEPQAQRDTRWTWWRMPVVENLSPAYRQVVGFWQHVEESRVNLDTGEVLSESRRAPSVIVYTPSGFVGVHFPRLGREAFAADVPTVEEAQAALRGYLGYFGALGVYPGEVSHDILAGVAPSAGAILRRYADIDGDALVVTLQGLGAPVADDGPRIATKVTLRRLSGADDMLPMQR